MSYECSPVAGKGSTPGCGEMFGSLRGFDAHLKDQGDDKPVLCLDPRTIKVGKRGLHQAPNGVWKEDDPTGEGVSAVRAASGGLEGSSQGVRS